MTLKTTRSCPGLIPTLHSIMLKSKLLALWSTPPSHQLKISHGGFLYFKEKTFFNSVMTTGNPKMDWYNILYFILGGSKITADGDCSHEIKRHLLLGRKVMTNLDSIFKSRDITLPTKVCLVKTMVSPVVMYGCESWTVKKAEP